MNFDGETVPLPLRNLSDKRLLGTASGADSRSST